MTGSVQSRFSKAPQTFNDCEAFEIYCKQLFYEVE
jgi:hypothetical protein